MKHNVLLPLCVIFLLIFIYSALHSPEKKQVAASAASVTAATATPDNASGSPSSTAKRKLTDDEIRQQNDAVLVSSSQPGKSSEASTTPSKPLQNRVVKHQPEGFMDSDKGDIVSVKKAVKAIRWSLNSDPKSAAEEDYQSILKYCATNESHNLRENLVLEVETNDYIVGNETANSDYLAGVDEAVAAGLKQKMEEQSAVAGPAPETHSMGGVSLFVHDAIKEVLSDPDSYKFVSVNGPWIVTHNGQVCWLEKVHFRARNGFNGMVTSTASVWVKATKEREDVLDLKMSSE